MFLPLLLLAAQAAQPLPSGLLRADTNRDGVVTRTEAAASADARFARFDADRNGSVTQEERRGARRAARAERRARPITAGQFQQRAQARFARLDADRDGVLSADERPQSRGMRGGHHDGGERGMRGADRGERGQAMTAAQFRDRALSRFDAADTNHDGRVDRAETAARRVARRG